MTTIMASDYEPLASAVQADPYPYYSALRRDAPVSFVESLQAYAVSAHADVRRVMHDNVGFSSQAMAMLVSRPTQYAAGVDEITLEELEELPGSIVGYDGATHTRLRLIVNRGFTPKRINRIEARVREIARGFVGELVRDGSGDLQAGLAVPLPTIAIAELLGVAPEQRDDFRRWSQYLVRAVFEPLDPAEQAEVTQGTVDMADWLEGVIAARAGTGGDDLVSVLLQAEAEGGALTPDELRVFVITLLVAGSITTAYLIGTAARMLSTDVALLNWVRDDLARIGAVVEETLRYDAPVQMMFRTATDDVEVAGTTIPRGATVAALLGSANRDERMFPEPDRFDPGRDATEHLAFGHGVHFCLGAALARLEARVALEELVTRATRLEPAGTPDYVSSLVFRGPTRLPLRYS
jgi:cytochrome P450